MPINPTITPQLRPMLDADLPFLLSLYASTRTHELAALNWSDEQKKFFINSQFQLQHHYYQQQFHSAQFHVITANGQDVGRLYYCWEDNNLRLIDIALLPEHQYQGIGGVLVSGLMEEVAACNGSLLLHVELNNPARDWYFQLGFIADTNDGVYQKLIWSTQQSAASMAD
ncbi:MAG: GNAT family N-acetyltransferase [Pseudomonadota bacterium]